MKTSLVTTNFTGGEFSPKLQGRTDLEKFQASCKLLSNWVILKQGGIQARPPLAYKGEVKISDLPTRPIPFVYSATTAYILEFGDGYMRVWRDGVRLAFEMATPYPDEYLADLRYTQSADTMILFHPLVFPQRLLRFSDTSWSIAATPFDPPPIGEVGHTSDSISLTAGALSGSGVGVTSSAPFFLPSDVGRIIVVSGSSATITSYGNSSLVTVSITAPFASLVSAGGMWNLEGTPMTDCTPSAKTPLGGGLTLTLAAGGWRPEDVGRYVEINGGVVKIVSLDGGSPTTIANGIIFQELTSTTAAPADAWVLKGPLWNAKDGYPSCGTFHSQRLWAASTRKYPQTAWGSRLGLSFDFTPGTNDDSAVYKTIASSEVNPLTHLVSAATLMLMGYAQEYSGRGGVEKGITQGNMQADYQSSWSTLGAVRPLPVGEEVLTVERSATVIRAFSAKQVEGFTSSPMSFFSEHLLETGVRSMAYEQRPESIVWVVTNDGRLHALTYNIAQNLVCFASGSTDGFVEWVATVPAGVRDATYAIVRRTIGGVTKRYLEMLDWTVAYGRHDSLIVLTAGSPQTVWAGLGHLEGRTVRVHGDDIFLGTFNVLSGQITIPRGALKLHVGLGFDSVGTLQPPILDTREGNSQGGSVSVHKVRIRLLNTVGLTVNGEDVPFRSFGASVLDTAVPLFTGVKDVTGLGWAAASDDTDDSEGIETTFAQTQGNPCTILSVVRNVSINAG